MTRDLAIVALQLKMLFYRIKSFQLSLLLIRSSFDYGVISNKLSFHLPSNCRHYEM